MMDVVLEGFAASFTDAVSEILQKLNLNTICSEKVSSITIVIARAFQTHL